MSEDTHKDLWMSADSLSNPAHDYAPEQHVISVCD